MNSNFIRLKEIYGHAFRGLVEPFHFKFPNSGMYLIKGVNQNTGDSSDSGKTSLLLAIAHLFGGCPYPSTQLQSFFTDDQYLVGAVLDIKGQKVVVERSKGLTVIVGKEKPVKGKEAEALLNRLFAMDAITRALVTYRGQGKPGLFLNLEDEKKKGFLSTLLGLDLYEKIAEEAEGKASILDKRLLELKTSLAIHQENLSSFTQQNDLGVSMVDLQDMVNDLILEIEKYRAIVVDLSKEHFAQQTAVNKATNELSTALDATRAKYKEKLQGLVLNNAAQEELNQLRVELDLLKAADHARQVQHEKDVSAIKSRGQACVARVKAGKEAATRLMGLVRDKQQLDESLCFTCNRPWQSDDISVQVQILGPKIKECSKLVNDGEQAAQEVLELKEQLQSKVWTSNPEIVALEQKALTAKAEVQKYKDSERARAAANESAEKEEIHLLKDQSAMKIYPLQKAVETILEKIGEHQLLIQSKDTEVAVLRSKLKNMEQLRKTHATYTEKVKSVTEEYEGLLLEYNAEKDLADLVGRKGFLGLIFDDVLSEAATAINEILSNVANVRHVSFDFESEKESKNGNVQTRITPVVTVHGERRPMESALSGGMKTAVQLAVDLGIGQIASQRCGSYPGWLILDESFDGLGKRSKESAIEMLQEYAKDRLVLVVDHSSEFQSLFVDTIQMTSLDGRVTVT